MARQRELTYDLLRGEGFLMEIQRGERGAAIVHDEAQSTDSQETDTGQYLSGQITYEEYRRRLEKSTPPARALQRSMVENRDFVRQVATWLRQDEPAASSTRDVHASVPDDE